MNHRTEPNADLRQMANFQHQYFVALVNEGFTEEQALRLLAVWLGHVLGYGGDES